jgi:hypothetical protein
MPTATFSGALLHESVPHMAAAYLFHIAKNHPFLDGNKRTALATAIAFSNFSVLTFGVGRNQGRSGPQPCRQPRSAARMRADLLTRSHPPE